MLMDRAVSEIQSTKVSFLGMDFAAKNEENNRVSWGLWFSNNFIPVAILTVFAPEYPVTRVFFIHCLGTCGNGDQYGWWVKAFLNCFIPVECRMLIKTVFASTFRINQCQDPGVGKVYGCSQEFDVRVFLCYSSFSFFYMDYSSLSNFTVVVANPKASAPLATTHFFSYECNFKSISAPKCE